MRRRTCSARSTLPLPHTFRQPLAHQRVSMEPTRSCRRRASPPDAETRAQRIMTALPRWPAGRWASRAALPARAASWSGPRSLAAGCTSSAGYGKARSIAIPHIYDPAQRPRAECGAMPRGGQPRAVLRSSRVVGVRWFVGTEQSRNAGYMYEIDFAPLDRDRPIAAQWRRSSSRREATST